MRYLQFLITRGTALTLWALVGLTALQGQTSLTILTTSLPAGAVGTPYAVGLTVGGGTAPYTWSSIGNLPPGLNVNSSGSITGTPISPGTFTFTIRVVDFRQLVGTRTFTVIVTGPKLSITTVSPLPAGVVGQNYSALLSSTGGTAPLHWVADSGFPPGLTLNPDTGAITGVPTIAQTFQFQVQVSDASQNTAVASMTLTVTSPPLTITTVPPLFTGTVGSAYSQSFSAAGGRPPYQWAILTGDTGGLTLDPSSGILRGTPPNPGTFSFTIQVSDSNGAAATRNFSVVVTPPTLTLIAGAPLAPGTVGVAYNQKLPLVPDGGTPPYSWSVISGSVPGLDLDPRDATLSGTPAVAGTFNFTVQVRDSAGLTASKSLALTIAPSALTITSNRQFPDGTLNVPYSVGLTASGGAPPYNWSANGLPNGLTINPSSGLISGTPTAAGNFGIAVTVGDGGLSRLTDRFTLNINLPPAPAFTVTGLPSTVEPKQQYPLQITAAATYPAPITGQAILTFQPDSGPVDRTIQFASGGTTANFTVPTGSATAVADVPLAIQTGTVAGTLSISIRIQAGGIDITPNPAPSISAQIVRAAPVITDVQATRSAAGIAIVVTGYTTAREVTQAVFAFNATSGQTLQQAASSITIDTNNLFSGWFQNAGNGAYGSQFVFTQPFSVQGDASAVIPISVTLTNRTGSTTANINR